MEIPNYDFNEDEIQTSNNFTSTCPNPNSGC